MSEADTTAAEQEIIDRGGLSAVFDQESTTKLGIKLDSNPATGAGVSVKNVTPDGQAIDAGVKPGDVIAFVNGQDVRDLQKLTPMREILKSHTKLRITFEDGTFIGYLC